MSSGDESSHRDREGDKESDDRHQRKTKVTTPSDREIATECVFDAPRERVFAAFTDPELILEWWGPRDTTTIVEEMDVQARRPVAVRAPQRGRLPAPPE